MYVIPEIGGSAAAPSAAAVFAILAAGVLDHPGHGIIVAMTALSGMFQTQRLKLGKAENLVVRHLQIEFLCVLGLKVIPILAILFCLGHTAYLAHEKSFSGSGECESRCRRRGCGFRCESSASRPWSPRNRDRITSSDSHRSQAQKRLFRQAWTNSRSGSNRNACREHKVEIDRDTASFFKIEEISFLISGKVLQLGAAHTADPFICYLL